MTTIVAAAIITSVVNRSEACEAPTIVAEVYPSTDALPENLLRFYVYFTKPMRSRAAVETIRIEEAAGDAITDAFLPTRFALWSPDRTRLTLVLDPGRDKTGLAAHDALGRALRAGKRYDLVIPEGLRDARGCRLAETYRKSFIVTQADLSPPAFASWKISVPPAMTRDQLTITLDGPHDHISLAYRLRVQNSAGDVVPGAIELAEAETSWLFRPRTNWLAANYMVVIDPALEDLAGNRIGAPFDQPTGSVAIRQNKKNMPYGFTLRVKRVRYDSPHLGNHK